MPKNLEKAATDLRNAYAGDTIGPLREYLEPTDIDSAYKIQAFNTDHWVAGGRKIIGCKVGLTAKSVQAQMGVDQPDFGILFDDMQIDDGGNLLRERVIQPRAEAEVALILSSDLPNRQVTQAEVEAAVGAAMAAIEIVDSRVTDWKITFADTVADNGSSAMFVLGSERKPLAGLDLWSCGMVLEVNDEVVSIGAGAACLGHPLNAATWLANTLQGRGKPMRKGDIVLTGALGPMVSIKPGDHVRTSIGGLGSASFRYGEST